MEPYSVGQGSVRIAHVGHTMLEVKEFTCSLKFIPNRYLILPERMCIQSAEFSEVVTTVLFVNQLGDICVFRVPRRRGWWPGGVCVAWARRPLEDRSNLRFLFHSSCANLFQVSKNVIYM